MANRFPLIFNSGAGQIQELAASDNLDLTSSNLVNAGILFTSSGSATAPSLQIGSGTTYNPGLYSPGTDQLAISTGGTGRLFVDANGKTGINATPPGGNQGLYVSVSSPTADTAGVQVKNASNAALEMLLTGATYSYAGVGANETWLRSSKAGAGSNLNIGSDESMAIKFISNATERARIRADGLFEIKGAGTAGSSPAFSVNQSAPTNSFFIDSSGRLGLGSNSPLYPLMIFRRAGSTITEPLLNLQSQNSGVDGDSFILFGTQTANWSAGVDQADSNKFRIEPTQTLGAATGLTITTAGNFGIGTTPAAGSLLHVNSAASTDCKQQLSVTTGTQAAFTAYVNTTVSTVGTENSTGGSLMSGSAPYATVISNGGAYPINFGTNNSIKATIDSSGRLLVGTSTAKTNYFGSGSIGSNFQVVGSSHAQSSVIIHNEAANDQGPYIHLGKARGTGFEIVSNDNLLGSLIYFGAGGSAMHPAASIDAFVDGTPGANDMPGRLVFSTTADGSASPTERMRINSSGQILAGTLGTAALPIISFLNDPNTGIFSPGADQLAISTSGTKRLTVDSGGNVSIDAVTDTGAKPLAIYSATRDAEIRLITNSGTEQNAYVTLRQSGGNLEFYSTNGAIIFNPANTERARIRADGLFEIKGAGTAGSSPAFSVNQSAPSNSFFIDSGGKLGLGTSSVTNSANLDIQLDTVSATDTYAKIQLRSGNYGYIIRGGIKQGAGGQLHFDLNNTNTITTMMTLDTGGKLGLGTSGPDRLLTIAGSAISGTQIHINSTVSAAGIKFSPASGDAYEIQAGTDSKFILYNRTDEAYRLVVDGSGNFGIGTTSPSQKLDVVGTIQSTNTTNTVGQTANVILSTANTNFGNVYSATLQTVLNNTTTGANDFFIKQFNHNSGYNDEKVFQANSGNSGYVALYTVNTERLRITSTGSVNIVGAGTAGSTQTVSLSGSAPINSIVMDSSGRLGLGTSSVSERFEIGTTTPGINDAVNLRINAGNLGGTSLRFYGGGNTSLKEVAKIKISASAYTEEGNLGFFTASNDGANNLTLSEKLTILSSGKVGIGSTGPSSRLVVQGATNTVDSQILITATSVASAYIGANADGLNLGTDTAGIVFKTGVPGGTSVGAATGERARIDSSGRLLVGSTLNSTGALVQIKQDNNLTSSTINVSTAGGLSVETSSGTQNYGSGIWFDHGSLRSGIAGSRVNTGNWGTDLRFYTHPDSTASQFEIVERMRIDSSGRLLVGTTGSFNGGLFCIGSGQGTNPPSGEHIKIAPSANRIEFLDSNSNASDTGSVSLFNTVYGNRSANIKLFHPAGNTGGIAFETHDGTSLTERIRIHSNSFITFNGANTDTSNGSIGALYKYFGLADNIVFAGETTGSDRSTIIEHRRTGRSGNARCSQIATGENSSNQGQVLVHSSAANADLSGGVVLSNGATSWASISDIRLKNITSSFDNALSAISTLEAFRFTWRDDANATPQVGLSAQSVQAVLPEAVSSGKPINASEDDDTEYLSVRYTEVIPLLVAALQESKQRIETLEAKVAALEGA